MKIKQTIDFVKILLGHKKSLVQDLNDNNSWKNNFMCCFVLILRISIVFKQMVCVN